MHAIQAPDPALAFAQHRIGAGHFLFGELQIVDVGAGSDPLEHDTRAVEQGHAAHQPPAVLAVGAADAPLDRVGFERGGGMLPGLQGKRLFVRMERADPAVATTVLHAHAV